MPPSEEHWALHVLLQSLVHGGQKVKVLFGPLHIDYEQTSQKVSSDGDVMINTYSTNIYFLIMFKGAWEKD